MKTEMVAMETAVAERIGYLQRYKVGNNEAMRLICEFRNHLRNQYNIIVYYYKKI